MCHYVRPSVAIEWTGRLERSRKSRLDHFMMALSSCSAFDDNRMTVKGTFEMTGWLVASRVSNAGERSVILVGHANDHAPVMKRSPRLRSWTGADELDGTAVVPQVHHGDRDPVEASLGGR